MGVGTDFVPDPLVKSATSSSRQRNSSWGPLGQDRKSGKKKCLPDQAEQFSFLGRVSRDSLEAVLGQSGFNGVYLQPIQDQTSSTTPWRVIWLHRARQDVTPEACKLPDQVGLARSLKFGVGIRVPSKSFGEYFQKLRPGDDIPHDTTGQTVYKIQPCPPGTDGASLRTWLNQCGWNGKPLRALGRDTWLIASADEPPKEALALNGHYLLIRPIQHRVSKPLPTVRAGTVHQKEVSAPSGDILQIHDPWAVGRAPARGPVLPDASQAEIQKHEKQLSELQAAVKQLGRQADQSAADSKLWRADVTREFGEVNQRISQEVTKLSTSFEASIAAVIAKQDERVNAGFSELKGMLLSINNSNAQQRSSTKRSVEGQSAMED